MSWTQKVFLSVVLRIEFFSTGNKFIFFEVGPATRTFFVSFLSCCDVLLRIENIFNCPFVLERSAERHGGC